MTMADSDSQLDFSPINQLSPASIPIESKSIRATVSLLWPYSSSTQQVALLLAEPDFRLRKKQGQIRVQFSGPSAQALARSRVGIGDEVLLSLQGAKWTETALGVSTPGKSVDAELLFKQRLSMKVDQLS
jgi:hypothetical protein